MLLCGVGDRCRCCGAALVSVVGIDSGFAYVTGVDVTVYVSGVNIV